MDMNTKDLKGRPRKWFLVPFLLGLALMAFGILCWVFPRLLLFVVCAPMVMAGLGLALFGLDLWRGVPQWRRHVETIHLKVWNRRDDETEL